MEVFIIVNKVCTTVLIATYTTGVVQSEQTGFSFNGESNLDLQFAMALVGKEQKVTLYQTGDDAQGKDAPKHFYSSLMMTLTLFRCFI